PRPPPPSPPRRSSDPVVLAMGPWTTQAIRGLRLPPVRGLKGYSVTFAAPDVPAQALFVDYRAANGRAFEPEIVPRPDGDVYVCKSEEHTSELQSRENL